MNNAQLRLVAALDATKKARAEYLARLKELDAATAAVSLEINRFHGLPTTLGECKRESAEPAPASNPRNVIALELERCSPHKQARAGRD